MSGKLGIWRVLYRSGQDAAAVPLEGEAGYWYADPLLFSWQGKIYLFLEAFFMPLQIGHIAVSVYENGRFGTPRMVLKTPYHRQQDQSAVFSAQCAGGLSLLDCQRRVCPYRLVSWCCLFHSHGKALPVRPTQRGGYAQETDGGTAPPFLPLRPLSGHL